MSATHPTQTAGFGLGRNAVWMFIGQCGYAAGQWAILIIIARLDGPALVGQFVLGLAITAPIVVFSQLQLREVQVVDAGGRHAFADYRAVRLCSTAGALIVISAVIALAGYEGPEAAVILSVGLTRSIESVSDIYYGLAQRHKRLDRVAQSMLLRSAFGCGALGVGLAITGSLVAALLAQACAWAAVWWLFDRRVARCWQETRSEGAFRERLRVRMQLAWLGLPLGVALLLGTLNVNVPRYVVESFFGREALGVFGALAQFIVVGNTVIMAICNAAIPRLADLYESGRIAPFGILLLQLCGVGALLGIVGVLFAVLIGEPLLYVMYGEAFSAQSRLLVGIMAVGGLWYTIAPLSSSLSAMRRFGVQPVMQAAAVGVSTLACLTLVPRIGIDGAVVGWGMGVVCQALVGLALVALYLRRWAERTASRLVFDAATAATRRRLD